MIEPEKKKKFKKYGLIIVCVILVGYFIFAFINSNINNSNAVATEIATRFTYKETISAKGVVVRNETLLDYNGSKVLYYTANDGDIVAAGSDVALVFSDEDDALNYNKYNEINRQIEVLEKLNTSHDNVKVDYAAIEKQIGLDIVNIISSVNTNTFSNINNSADDLVYSINQRQIITGKVANFDKRITELKAESEKYSDASSKIVDTVTLDNNVPGGYFVAYVDGYESAYNYDNITELTVDTFNAEPDKKEVDDNTIGKIVSGLNWYVVCKLSADEALTLSHATESSAISFVNTTCSDIPATLVALNQNSKQSDAVAVFKCNYMNSALSHLRSEDIQITVNTYDGIKISKNAVHNDYVTVPGEDEKKKVLGVYVAYGNKLEFKEISILYSGSDFVIVDETPEDGVIVGDETVKFNDEVVVRGDNLYAGKSIEKH